MTLLSRDADLALLEFLTHADDKTLASESAFVASCIDLDPNADSFILHDLNSIYERISVEIVRRFCISAGFPHG